MLPSNVDSQKAFIPYVVVNNSNQGISVKQEQPTTQE